MKKLVLPLLLLSAVTFAQNKDKVNYFSLSLLTDVRNAAIGSQATDNKRALDLIAGLHIVKNNFEYSVGYEYFNAIGFSRDMLNFGYHSERYIPESWIPFANKDFEFTAIPRIGASIINRFEKPNETNPTFKDLHASWWGVQCGLSLRAKLTDHVLIDVTAEFLTRKDIK